MTCIDNYLSSILTNQLKAFEVSDAACKQVVENVKLQMLSLLQCWHDEEFRNTILFVGMEEGMFYKPNAKIEVKCFVVVTIRNSLLETLASDDYKCLNVKRVISDSEIREITAGAIEYFSKVDFEQLTHSQSLSNIQNIYENIKRKYPVAWRAISAAGNTMKKHLRYEKVNAVPDNELICLISQQESKIETTSNKVVISGYDEAFDDTLIKILKYAYSNPDFVFFRIHLR